jgi:hypothetical protein
MAIPQRLWDSANDCSNNAMAHRLIQRLFIVLSLLAFTATGLAQAAMLDATVSPGKALAMSGMSDSSMPCCPEKAPSCNTDVGCIFLVGLPMPVSALVSTLAWSVVTYPASHDGGEGLSILPALGPPILLA